MKRFAPGGLIFVCINEKTSSLIKYTWLGAESDGGGTNLSQEITGERNAEGEVHVGSPRLKPLPPKLKESSNYYLSPFSTFFVDYLLWEPCAVNVWPQASFC